MLGLVAALRAELALPLPKGQNWGDPIPLIEGEGGLGGRELRFRDRRAETAEEWYADVPGVVGGVELEKPIEVGRDGEAWGIMSLGSVSPEAWKG